MNGNKEILVSFRVILLEGNSCKKCNSSEFEKGKA